MIAFTSVWLRRHGYVHTDFLFFLSLYFSYFPIPDQSLAATTIKSFGRSESNGGIWFEYGLIYPWGSRKKVVDLGPLSSFAVVGRMGPMELYTVLSVKNYSVCVISYLLSCLNNDGAFSSTQPSYPKPK